MCTLTDKKEYTYSEFGQEISNNPDKIPDTTFNHYTKVSEGDKEAKMKNPPHLAVVCLRRARHRRSAIYHAEGYAR